MRLIRIGLAATALAVFVAAPVLAARPTSLYYFFDCTGDGPSSFWAVKTATPPTSGGPVSAGSAFGLTDGTATYQILSFGNPPGIAGSAGWNLECTVTFDGNPTTVMGRFAVE